MSNNFYDSLTEIRKGWVWPKKDEACWTFLTNPKRDNIPKQLSSLVSNHRVVVQAGGNAGMYPRQYEEFFDTVYTFEPDYINFYCLVRNTTDKTIKFQACLGNDKKTVGLSNRNHDENLNFGGFHVQGAGMIPTVKIDDLNLPYCDLIHLDIEGYEKEALLGSEQTIKKFSPVIVLEMVNLSQRYGTTDADIIQLLAKWGYSNSSNIRKEDFIFIRK
jgi:FkbM family methyltransferase